MNGCILAMHMNDSSLLAVAMPMHNGGSVSVIATTTVTVESTPTVNGTMTNETRL